MNGPGKIMVEFVSDGVPAVVDKNNGVVAKLKKKRNEKIQIINFFL
jgi:hypothetical protein